MYTLLNTLYVMTQGSYVHLENSTVRIDIEKEKRLQVPLHHLDGVVCFGNVMISPFLVHRLADEGKSLVLLEESGRFKARMEGPVSGNILMRQAQHRAAADRTATIEIARAIVAGKLKNSRAITLRGAREASDQAEASALNRVSDNLAASLRALRGAANIDTIRGIEGEAARGYFEAMNLIVKPQMRQDFALQGRTRRPPLDRFNALLSFLYSMLMNVCRSAIEAVGLDPQLGFLHAVRPGRAALALDLQEEFRAVLADRLALTVINLGQIRAGDFESREGGAVLLNEQGRKTVIASWQERRREELLHPVLNTRIPVGLLPLTQARMLARTVRGECEGYVPYLYR